MDENAADSGSIFAQVPFEVTEVDDGASFREKANNALAEAFDIWQFPKLAQGIWEPVPQDEAKALPGTANVPQKDGIYQLA